VERRLLPLSEDAVAHNFMYCNIMIQMWHCISNIGMQLSTQWELVSTDSKKMSCIRGQGRESVRSRSAVAVATAGVRASVQRVRRCGR
jgi:hypothetical protein